MTKSKAKPAEITAPVVEKVTFEAVLDGDLFARANKCRSHEETRYYLGGVNVEPTKAGGAILVATNGSILVAIRDPEALVRGSAIVRLGAPLLLALGRKAKSEFRHVTPPRRYLVVRGYNTGKSRAFVVDQATIFTKDKHAVADPVATRKAALTVLDEPDQRVVASQFYAAIIDGKFPDWRNILPALALEPKAGMWTFSEPMLASLAQALCPGRLSPMSSPSMGLRILSFGPHDAALVRSYAGLIDGFGIIMSMRDDGGQVPTVASWARLEEPAA